MVADIVWSFVYYLTNVLLIAILVRVVISWLSMVESFRWLDGSAFSRLAWDVTEPVLGPIRRLLPAAGGIDFSPMIAGVLLIVVRGLVQSALTPYF